MTEDEAKTKWCPFSRAVGGNVDVTINRIFDSQPDDDCYCIGSACMAWRWRRISVTSGGDLTEIPIKTDGIEQGFCGLAGRP